MLYVRLRFHLARSFRSRKFGELNNVYKRALINAEDEGQKEAIKMRAKRNAEDVCNDIVTCSDDDQTTRRIDGRCNNLDNPRWGSACIEHERYIDPEYDDDLGKRPRGGWQSLRKDIKEGRHGEEPQVKLPNARKISQTFHRNTTNEDTVLTHMVTQWGQFLDHDIVFTPEVHITDCCSENKVNADCFPIKVDANDPFYSMRDVKQHCLEFSRSEGFICNELDDLPRNQVNEITAFIDASNIYGSDDDRAKALRSFSGGKLLSDFTSDGLHEILPEVRGERYSGDIRALEMPGLAAMHTLFLREHNHLAEMIANADLSLNDEEIYQKARGIVIAEMQQITYREFLPAILGEQFLTDNGMNIESTRTTYDPQDNPSIHSAFATSSYRFGHSMIQGLIEMLFLHTQNTNVFEEYRLRNEFFSLDRFNLRVGEDLGMELILKGLINQPAESCDKFVTEDVTNFLLRKKRDNFGGDLVARNIQRGRDHGLAGYGAWREFCGLDDLDGWDNRPEEILEENWTELRGIYEEFGGPEDMDLFTAGLAEKPDQGAIMGKTFACLNGMQFRSLLFGDRFFITHDNGVFGDPQLEEIRQRKLSHILCDNTLLDYVRENVFTQTSPMVKCDDFVPFDVTLFL